ncbi:hypothetical protein ACQ4PT_009441 [Festuca glaucescens]
MLVWRQPFLSAGMAGHGWGFALWIYDNFSRSPTSRTIGDALLLLSTPEEDTEYPFIDKLAVEDRAQPAEIPSLDLTRKEKTITFVFSRRRKGKPGPDNKMHNTNNKCTDDVAIARPVENAKECATSLAVAVNKKGSQVHKSLSIDNRDKAPSSSAIARPKTSGRKKKASKKEKHSTDSAIVPTKGKGDEGSNDGGNPTSSSQVVLYDPRVEECAVDTTLEETGKGRTKRSLPSKDNGKEALPAKRRRTSKNLLPSKDSEAASDKDFLMCQMSIQTIIDAANQLKKIPELIKSVRDAGFGHFIDTKIRGSINRLCVGIAPRISAKEASMVKGLDYGKIRDMDFCQLVVDELQSSATNWQGHELLKYKYMEGLAVAPLIMYLDSLIYKDLAHMGKETPRVLFLDEKKLTAISKADRNIGAQKGKEDWVFGKIIATCEQQVRVEEEGCKNKSKVMPKKKKKNHKDSNKTDSIGDQQLEEVHPDLEHHAGSLPDILNPGNPHIQESNKELAIQMSGKKDAEAERPELVTTAATITGMRAHKLAESHDPKDAETSNIIAEADAPDLETSAATISETSADMLAESPDPNIKIPCFGEGDKDYPVGHYFVMAVNLRRKRFELLDSLGGEGAEQHFVNTAGVFKEIWKEAYKQSKGKLSPKNLDDFSYEKPKVIPLQGDTLNCGVYMIMVLMFWTRKTLFHIRREDILYIRKRLLYLVLMWEKLEVNLDLIETFHKDDLIKINLGEYNLIRKWTTVKPTMTVIVSLPNVNIPEPKEIDDGK